jgi:hypothetical protein
MGGRSSVVKNQQNRVIRANGKSSLAAKIKKGVEQEMRLKALEEKVPEHKPHEFVGNPGYTAEYHALKLRQYELDKCLEFTKSCEIMRDSDPIYASLKKAADESEANAQKERESTPERMPTPSSQSQEKDAEEVLSLRDKITLLRAEADEAWAELARLGAEINRQKEERERDYEYFITSSGKRGLRLRSKIVDPQELKDNSSETTLIKEKPPRSPRVPGEDNLLRDNTSDDDMLA